MIQSIIFDFFGVIFNHQGIDKELLELIKELKQEHNIYLLSNSNREVMIRQYPQIDFNKVFHECIFSSDTPYSKPQTEVFKYTLDKLNLKAEETLFIDDAEENTNAAKQIGIKTHTYETLTKLKYYLKELGIK